ncbi:uncharacterized, partial [Tachysurus ichikawai]
LSLIFRAAKACLRQRHCECAARLRRFRSRKQCEPVIVSYIFWKRILYCSSPRPPSTS